MPPAINEAEYLGLFKCVLSLENNKRGTARAREIIRYLKFLVKDSKLDVRRAYTHLKEEKERLENSVKSAYPEEFNMGTPAARRKRLRVVHSFMGKYHRAQRDTYQKNVKDYGNWKRGATKLQVELKPKYERLNPCRYNLSGRFVDMHFKNSKGSTSYSSAGQNQAYAGRRELYVSVPPLQTKQPTKSSGESGEPVSALTNKKQTKTFNEVLDSNTTIGNRRGRPRNTKRRKTPYSSSSRAKRAHRVVYVSSPASTRNRPAFTGNAIIPEAKIPAVAVLSGPVSGDSTTREITAARPRRSLRLNPSTPGNVQIDEAKESEMSAVQSATEEPIDQSALADADSAKLEAALVPEEESILATDSVPVEPSVTHTEHPITRANLDEMTELRHFLSTCEPSLLKFLPQFVAVGCRNKQYLRAVSKLSEYVLKEFIESVANSDEERRMNVTEKFILREWFRKYFDGVSM